VAREPISAIAGRRRSFVSLGCPASTTESVSPLVGACLARIEPREPILHAWSSLDPEFALHQARERDKGPVLGPLHGVPVGVKDVIDTADLPTEMGSPIYTGHRPAADAACVALLRAAGAVILGKTVTAEFAGTAPGPTTNPHDPAHTPGGSSNGSAAAVADFMVPVAFGTQTGGSIQRPASYCGIVGHKPTYGAIARTGLEFAAESLDTIGLMARTLDDIAPFTDAWVARHRSLGRQRRRASASAAPPCGPRRNVRRKKRWKGRLSDLPRIRQCRTSRCPMTSLA
jgi:Asp-tRNA(Asn)/Glu-tRNA(Gln) amidotransferase A subunit family amidase